MAPPKSIEISLPQDMPTGNAEILKATLQAIVALRCDCSQTWEQTLEELKEDGWRVQWRMTWVAEARRGNFFEQVSGGTLDDAFEQLKQITRLDAVAGCP